MWLTRCIPAICLAATSQIAVVPSQAREPCNRYARVRHDRRNCCHQAPSCEVPVCRRQQMTLASAAMKMMDAFNAVRLSRLILLAQRHVIGCDPPDMAGCLTSLGLGVKSSISTVRVFQGNPLASSSSLGRVTRGTSSWRTVVCRCPFCLLYGLDVRCGLLPWGKVSPLSRCHRQEVNEAMLHNYRFGT